MRKATHLGELQLTDGSTLLLAGVGSALLLWQALRADSCYSAIVSDWIVEPIPLQDWAARFGIEDPALDLALHVDDTVPFVTSRRPDPSNHPENAIPRLFDPLETVDAPRLEKTDNWQNPDGPESPLPALLDAAAVFGLPERLEAETANRCCIFSGAARAEMGDVAPWLAMLPLESSTVQDAIAQDGYLGFFPPEPLHALRAHLKHYTKIRRADDSWVYLRLCNHNFLDWIRLHPAGPFPKKFFRRGTGVLLPEAEDGQCFMMRPADADELRHDDFLEQFERFTRTRLRRKFVMRAAKALTDVLGQNVSLLRIIPYYRAARDAGYFRERALVRMIEAELRLEGLGVTTSQIEEAPELAAYQTSSDVHRSGAVLEAARRYAGAIT